MTSQSATATAHPNIAFIKYWGNEDHDQRIPTNGSISMNLDGLETKTIVTFDSNLSKDKFRLNGNQIKGPALARVSSFLDLVRKLAGEIIYAHVESENDFPTSAGMASSASAFAALSLAASSAAGLDLNEAELSKLARLGSGSACRSIPTGFVEWKASDSHESSYAESIAAPDHWNLVDCIAIVNVSHKTTGSTKGHLTANTSIFQNSRIKDANRRLKICRNALLEKDFSSFANIVELDSNLMHAVMITSQPALIYWEPATLAVMKAVQNWRSEGLQVCYTIDAGANVHVVFTEVSKIEIKEKLLGIQGVMDVLTATPGGPAKLV